jgi:lipid A 3-O-deacylase
MVASRFALLGLAFVAVTGIAHAEVVDYTKASQTAWYIPSEGRFGFGATDPTTGHELSADANAQILLQPIGNDSWWNELRFRPEAGINVNLEGRTSFVDLGGTFDLLNYDGFFFDFTLGGAVHDGYLYTPNDVSHKRFGSRFEFRENLEAGYEFSPIYSLSLFVDHLSNGGMLSKYNQGIETAGVHFNVKFDQ